MSRTARTRSRAEIRTGFYTQFLWNGNPILPPTSQTVTRTSTIDDSHGRPVVPSPLSSLQRKGQILVNGTHEAAHPLGFVPKTVYDNFPINTSELGSTLDFTALSAPSGWETTAVARSNPSRPVVFPLEIAQDIISIPKMLVNLKRILEHPKTHFSPKGFSNGYLELQFGWLPLIEDFQKLSATSDYVARRIKMYKELQTGRNGLRRKISFGSDHSDGTIIKQLTADNSVANILINETVKKKSWATVRWRPTGTIPYSLDDPRSVDYFRKVVLGLTVEGLVGGVWKVLPWTWLIGWFTNIGDFLMISSNSIPAIATEACFMSQVEYTQRAAAVFGTGGDAKSLPGATGSYTYTNKSRAVASSLFSLSASMPVMDMFRLSIAGALAIQRIAR